MQQNISEKRLREILGAKLADHDMIDSKMEEAYAIIRESDGIKTGKNIAKGKAAGKVVRRAFVGLGSAAALFLLAFVFCVMNPVLASEIPVLGSFFAKVADVFPFGKIPEEQSESLYNEEENTEEENAKYQVTEGDVTVTLEGKYITNQALFLAIRIENAQEFPEMAALVTNGGQWLDVRTKEEYSFHPDQVWTRRRIEGKFEDAHTFIGVMRIDYSDIPLDYDTIPDFFDMTFEITQIIGTLKNPTQPEGMKSDEELAQMTYEELGEYRNSLPREWVGFPNVYQHWFQDGSWRFELPIAQTDEAASVIFVNEVNEEGIGIESIELSTVEMTIHPVNKTTESVITTVFDAYGEEIFLPRDGANNDVYVITGRDISTVSIYICRFSDYEEAQIEYENPENNKSFRELIEERALFQTMVTPQD